jgi:perosamine synthetase
VGVLRASRLSLGPKLQEFEERMAEYIGVPHCVALSSGTAGLHLGLLALGIGEGDEVILPSFTFIAAANSVLYQRGVPVFVDIDPITLNLDPGKVEGAITSRTRAIMAVHTFGRPADLRPLLDIAKRYGLRLIEDGCEAIGAEYEGQKVGGFGDLGVFSFYPNKPITTGEGGVVVTRDAGLAAKIRALRNQGRKDTDGWLEHSLLGYNYRIPDINCALGITQLSRIDTILVRREVLATRYCQELQAMEDVITPPLRMAGGRLCWFAFVVRLSSRFTQSQRDWILRDLTARGIGCRQYFPPVHRQTLYSAYANRGYDLAVTEHVSARTIALPFFNRLTDEQIRDVCRNLRESITSAAAGKEGCH